MLSYFYSILICIYKTNIRINLYSIILLILVLFIYFVYFDYLSILFNKFLLSCFIVYYLLTYSLNAESQIWFISFYIPCKSCFDLLLLKLIKILNICVCYIICLTNIISFFWVKLKLIACKPNILRVITKRWL